MKIPSFIKDAQKFLDANSPVILTGVAIVGVAATAVLTHKAATESIMNLSDEATKRANGPEQSGDISAPDRIAIVWKNYVPPVAVGAGTMACMLTATRINLRRTAVFAALYAVTDERAKEYRAKAEEIMGKTKSDKVNGEIIQDHVTKYPPQDGQVIITGKGDDLCLDRHTGRYFLSTIEDLKHAQNRLNHRINLEGSASLSEFYDYIGIDHTQFSDAVGWSNMELMELTFGSALTDKGVPVLAIEYNVVPQEGYDRVHG